jgi:hypothetical protein
MFFRPETAKGPANPVAMRPGARSFLMERFLQIYAYKAHLSRFGKLFMKGAHHGYKNTLLYADSAACRPGCPVLAFILQRRKGRF